MLKQKMDRYSRGLNKGRGGPNSPQGGTPFLIKDIVSLQEYTPHPNDKKLLGEPKPQDFLGISSLRPQDFLGNSYSCLGNYKNFLATLKKFQCFWGPHFLSLDFLLLGEGVYQCPPINLPYPPLPYDKAQLSFETRLIRRPFGSRRLEPFTFPFLFSGIKELRN